MLHQPLSATLRAPSLPELSRGRCTHTCYVHRRPLKTPVNSQEWFSEAPVDCMKRLQAAPGSDTRGLLKHLSPTEQRTLPGTRPVCPCPPRKLISHKMGSCGSPRGSRAGGDGPAPAHLCWYPVLRGMEGWRPAKATRCQAGLYSRALSGAGADCPGKAPLQRLWGGVG